MGISFCTDYEVLNFLTEFEEMRNLRFEKVERVCLKMWASEKLNDLAKLKDLEVSSAEKCFPGVDSYSLFF